MRFHIVQSMPLTLQVTLYSARKKISNKKVTVIQSDLQIYILSVIIQNGKTDKKHVMVYTNSDE